MKLKLKLKFEEWEELKDFFRLCLMAVIIAAMFLGWLFGCLWILGVRDFRG